MKTSDWFQVRYEPSRALNARSTFQLLAFRMALTTASSTVGKASFSVFTDCSRGLMGRGGFGGAAGGVSGTVCWAGDTLLPVEITPDSCGSSSKSRGRAVVGDSARGLFGATPADGLLGVDCESEPPSQSCRSGRIHTVFSSSDMVVLSCKVNSRAKATADKTRENSVACSKSGKKRRSRQDTFGEAPNK